MTTTGQLYKGLAVEFGLKLQKRKKIPVPRHGNIHPYPTRMARSQE
jgi:hypothetical protein